MVKNNNCYPQDTKVTSSSVYIKLYHSKLPTAKMYMRLHYLIYLDINQPVNFVREMHNQYIAMTACYKNQ